MMKDQIEQPRFLWGSASASYQCEGAWNEDGKGMSCWDRYFHEEATTKENGDRACDFYHHYETDLQMMEASHQNTFRFSLSWPRLFPKQGEVNEEGVRFYHKLLDSMREKGIEPNVTLYHWDLPDYLQEKGGWLNKETAYAFAEFADFCFREFGDQIRLWVTLNEPYYSLQCMYGAGNYPPHEKNGQHFILAAYHEMLASALAIRKFRQYEGIGTIGIVADIHPCYGVDSSEATNRAVRLADQFCNGWVVNTAIKGEFPQELIEALSDQYDFSCMEEKDQQLFREGVVDFIGLNYYNRSLIRPYTSGESMIVHYNTAGNRSEEKKKEGRCLMRIKDLFERIEDPNGIYTAWDFEIFPKGLYDACMEITKKYGPIPIYITENGIGLHETIENGKIDDDARIDFLEQHLHYLLKAIEDGANIKGFYVWSTMDLYSWMNGHEKRYGLVYVDFETMERTPKKSYFWYKRFIDEHL